ncbi:hypothetical protein G7081_00510 [Vagococcus coleopterorum]|uniref:ATPase BadF/BadG/BcrA/BcrD type domain-containing protein n=1 Tax=Vagococcus coleopterorum TaxID=2714946 RepID=A0A6G8AKQ9_9ENTE|nr:BadF/BadG/BcrA/BcrD ATPase family protein [Vagococcus coleopterorum]QIL45674.1 hypothetical protein G7081_00510 [Vagococcus coleopterorum]
MSYVIGVDAGGTKTEVTSYNVETEEEQATITVGAGNFIEDMDGALVRIIEGIKTVKSQHDPSEKCELILIGAAGLNASNEEAIILEKLQAEFADKIVLTGDGELAHYAILKGRDGELIIAGTGSVIISKQGNKWASYGGWGPLLGDEGSGYRLGLALAKNCLTEYDLNLEPSELSQAVLAHLKCEDIKTLPGIVRDLTKPEIASITQVLIDHPDDEPIAQDIVSREAQIFAEEYMTFYEMTYTYEEIFLGLNGGIIVNNETFLQAFIEKIQELGVAIGLAFPDSKISKGAYYWYVESLNK